jgi:hypothetical protein
MSEIFFLYFLCKGFFCAYTRVKRTSGESFERVQGERRERKFLRATNITLDVLLLIVFSQKATC